MYSYCPISAPDLPVAPNLISSGFRRPRAKALVARHYRGNDFLLSIMAVSLLLLPTDVPLMRVIVSGAVNCNDTTTLTAKDWLATLTK